MSEIQPRTPFGRTIFCDDIRQEIGGKISLIGVYAGGIFVLGDPPYTIPKFCMLVEYMEGLNANSPPISLQVFLPGDLDQEPSLKFDLPTPPNEIPIDPFLGTEAHIGNRIPIILAPLVIPSEGRIKVRMKRGVDYVALGSLVIRTAQSIDENGNPVIR